MSASVRAVPAEIPQPAPAQGLIRIVILGHVDHGKSTLVGRLLHETGSLPPGKTDAIRTMSEKRGMPFEWAFLLDAMQAERNQGITIDTTQIWLRTRPRETVIIDAPGHAEFLKNMVTGASQADAALVVVDAQEGVREQTRRHSYLLHLIGVRQAAIVINKMDLAGFSEERYRAIAEEARIAFERAGLSALAIVPVSARDGDNIAEPSPRMPWYHGPTVLSALAGFSPGLPAADLPLRLPVQAVYKFDDRRIIAGRIEAGRLSVGDTLVFSPGNKSARVASIEAWSSRPGRRAPLSASAGESIGITLDEQIFVDRGSVASHADAAPVLTDVLKARVFWLAPNPLIQGETYRLRLATLEVPVRVEAVTRVFDPADLEGRAANAVGRNQAAEVLLRARRLIALDAYESSPRTGRFVLLDAGGIAGGGVVDLEGITDQRALVTPRATNITRVAAQVSPAARAARNGHKGGVLWFTGLSGAGKSTLAVRLEQELFARGYHTFVLDGDNLRHGLNADLGFSPEDRTENIRRAGEVAALFAAAGLVVITSFISPYRSDRTRARGAAGEVFHEVHVKADLAVCEARDPKGLYRKARAGAIKDFTGVSAPYEPPQDPELVIDTSHDSVEACVDKLLAYVEANFRA